MASACTWLSAPFGRVALWATADQICRVALSPEPLQQDVSRVIASPAVEDLSHQLERYFEDPFQRFQFDGVHSGTDFQQRVWRALKEIPPGEVRTYGELARSLGSGPRAVAAACRANPWPLLIPCHRIVGSNGEGGYCGYTEGPYLAIKRWLLTHEGWR